MTLIDARPQASAVVRPTPIRWTREAVIWAMVAVSFPLVALLEPGDAAEAVARAERLAAGERRLGLHAGPDVLAAAGNGGLLRTAAMVVYYGAHVPAVVALFVWLGVRRPGDYRTIRRMFVAAHVMTIAIYVTLPTAPPRLVPSLGGADHRSTGAGWHALQYEFAALPSGHVIFAAVVGIALVRLGSPMVRAVGVAYPVLVVVVTVTTDNHFVTDALLGLVVVGVAAEVARVSARVSARTPADRTAVADWARMAAGSAPAPSAATAPCESRRT
jgi:hypothetical protein